MSLPRTLATVAVLALAPWWAAAQEAEAPSIDDAALRAAAQEYVNGVSQQRMIDRMLSADSFVERIRAANPQMPPQLAQRAGQAAAEEMAQVKPALEAAMVDSAVETFTLDEMEALNAFYSSPEGEAVLEKMQPYLSGAMAEVQPELSAAQEAVQSRIRDIVEQSQ